ncbi:MAG: T9SS type A sorting domain-containing protein [Cyanothece sp. SIO1E1]|nr:T9SS type A sorting domain-containing protein [Cyanothece sp. SIO1E1]
MKRQQICFAALLILLLAPYLLSSANIVRVKSKSDTGNDLCERLGCFDLLAPYNSTIIDNNVELEITINLEIPNSEFTFPWKVRAYSDSGVYLGQTDAIYDNDFIPLDEKTSLRRVKTKIVLLPGGISRAILEDSETNSECLTDRCGDDYSPLNISFSIFSGLREIDETCTSFISPDLVEGSFDVTRTFRGCQCITDLRPDTRSISSQHYRGQANSIAGVKSINDNDTDPSSLEFKEDISYSNLEQINVYPNPVSSVLSIEANLNIEEKAIVQIINRFGAFMKTNLEYLSLNRTQIDVRNFPPGLYLIKITVGEEFVTKKVMITP